MAGAQQRCRGMIEGFDYRIGTSGKKVEFRRAEWQDMIDDVVQAGGRRRVEQGETFASLHGVLQFEVYAIIPVKGKKPDEVVDDGSDLV